MNTLDLSKKRWFLLAIFAIAILFRIPDLGLKSIWGDEATSIYVSMGVTTANDHPPGYYFLSGLAVKLFGLDEFQTRIVSAICGLLLIWGIYLWCELLHRNWPSFPRSLGLISSFWIAVSPYFIQLSQEGRPYSLLAAAAAWSSYFFLLILEKKGVFAKESEPLPNIILPVVGYVLTTALGMYSHHFAWFIPLSQGIFWLYLLAARPQHRKNLLVFALIFLVLLLCYLPILSDTVSKVTARSRGIEASQRQLSLMYYFTNPVISVFYFTTGYFFSGLRTNAAFAIGHITQLLIFGLFLISAGGVVIAGLLNLLKQAFKFRAIEPVIYLILGFAVSLFCALTIDTSIARQHSISAVFLTPVIGLGIWALKERLLKIFLGMYGIVLLISLGFYFSINTHPFYQVDWRKAAEYMKGQYRQGDVVYVAHCEREGFYSLRFYGFDRDMVFAKRAVNPENQPTFIDPVTEKKLSEEGILNDLLQKTNRLWFIHGPYYSGQDKQFSQMFDIKSRALFGRDIEICLIENNTPAP